MPAALQGVYVAQAPRPDRSGPALEAARDRLRIAWEHLVHAAASPEGRRELAWLQARCQTSMGGAGVYDAYELRGACYAACFVKNWPLLQRISMAGHNFRPKRRRNHPPAEAGGQMLARIFCRFSRASCT